MKTIPKIFRVLVVDDKKPVLKALGDWIKPSISISNEEFQIELIKLHIHVIHDGVSYKIDESSIKNLHDICNKPFHLMLLDFGYVKEGLSAADEIERLHKINPAKTKRQLIDEVVLNPTHLVETSRNNVKYSKNIEKYFVNHYGKLIVYTYIPSQMEDEYTCADVRENITNKYFPKVEIEVVDTRKELFNNTMFDKIYKDYKEYYSFLISKYLSKLIKIEIAESMLDNFKRQKIIIKKIKKNNRILTFSTILPSIIAGIFIPSLFSSLEKGEYIISFSFFITLLMLIVILTVGTKILERNNERLLK